MREFQEVASAQSPQGLGWGMWPWAEPQLQGKLLQRIPGVWRREDLEKPICASVLLSDCNKYFAFCFLCSVIQSSSRSCSKGTNRCHSGTPTQTAWTLELQGKRREVYFLTPTKKLFLVFKTKKNSSAKWLKVSVQQHDSRYDSTANLIRGKQMWGAPLISCLLGLDLSCDCEFLLPPGDRDVHTILLEMHLRIIESWFVRESPLSAVGINLLMR